MKKKSLTVLLATLTLCVAQAGRVFYWRTQYVTNSVSAKGASVEFYDWSSFGDSGNWSIDRTSYNNEDALVPGVDDMVYSAGWQSDSGSWTLGRFNLDGNTFTIGGFSLGTFPVDISAERQKFLYKPFVFALTNGTLIIKNPNKLNYVSRKCEIFSGATLVYSSGVKVSVSHANQDEFWTVKAGGRMDVMSGLNLIQLKCAVEPEGMMNWNPDSLDVSQSTQEGKINTITNRGTFIAPKGIVWDGSDKFGAKTKIIEVAQMSGELRMGGNFTKTIEERDKAGQMRFLLGGGKLVAEKDVAFKNSVSKWGG